jgi:DNA primase
MPDFQESPVPRQSDATKAAIKNAVDIVALVGEYLPLRRAGSKFKALCPFHNDHNPSLEVNPERQSFKCWVCAAGGDVFDFVQKYERVDFPEALRMLAERAGIVLESPSAAVSAVPRGPSKSDLLAVQAWAEQAFRRALARSEPALAYIEGRGLKPSVERFRVGYAPAERGWLTSEARKQGFSAELLEESGLISRSEDSPGLVRERFRGRLIFPIHDEQGRTIGFGGRILPELEREMAAHGKNVAKYLNSPETALFQKRRVLYAADLARTASREAGWVAVVEGYTDVIAAHQVGLCNVVGTLGTALGQDHVRGLKRLADLVVLVFDGDAAGQSAADRALEFFLGQELDVRVLTLPANLDPCDFLLKEGADAFRVMVKGAADPLAFALDRAGVLFEIGSVEGARRAAEWVLGILSRVPTNQRIGLDLKLAKSLDSLAHRLGLEVGALKRRLQQLRKISAGRPAPAGVGVARPAPSREGAAADSPSSASPDEVLPSPPFRLDELDPIDRELVQVALGEPGSVSYLVSRIAPASLRDAPLRAILQACYDLHGEGQTPQAEGVMDRLDDPRVRSLVAGLLLPPDPNPLPEDVRPAPWQDRLAGVLATLERRERQHRLRDLRRALDETDENDNPDAYRALQLEYRRLMTQRPDTRKDAS